MSKFMLNGKPYGGSTNYASSVACTDAEGNESTVQAEIDELNKNIVPSVTNNIIVQNKAVVDTEIYTATENCHMMVLMSTESASGIYVYVNGIVLHHTYIGVSGTHQLSWGCYLRKGDTVQFHRDTVYPSSVAIFVYGIK